MTEFVKELCIGQKPRCEGRRSEKIHLLDLPITRYKDEAAAFLKVKLSPTRYLG